MQNGVQYSISKIQFSWSRDSVFFDARKARGLSDVDDKYRFNYDKMQFKILVLIRHTVPQIEAYYVLE